MRARPSRHTEGRTALPDEDSKNAKTTMPAGPDSAGLPLLRTNAQPGETYNPGKRARGQTHAHGQTHTGNHGHAAYITMYEGTQDERQRVPTKCSHTRMQNHAHSTSAAGRRSSSRILAKERNGERGRTERREEKKGKIGQRTRTYFCVIRVIREHVRRGTCRANYRRLGRANCCLFFSLKPWRQ